MRWKFFCQLSIVTLCLYAYEAIPEESLRDRHTLLGAKQETKMVANGSAVTTKELAKSAQAAKAVVEKYLDLSANGAWLSYDGRIEIGRLTEWTPNERHLMSIEVISSYRVSDVSPRGDAVEVFVDLDVVGWLVEELYKFEVRHKTVRTTFRVQKRDETWIILGPDYPTVYWQEVVRHLERVAPNMAKPDHFRRLAKVIADAAGK